MTARRLQALWTPAVLCRAEDPAPQRGCGAKVPAPNTTLHPTSLPGGPSASLPGRHRPKHRDSHVIRAVAVGFVQGTENHHVCCRLSKVAMGELTEKGQQREINGKNWFFLYVYVSEKSQIKKGYSSGVTDLEELLIPLVDDFCF